MPSKPQAPVIWTNFHHVNRVDYAKIQLEISFAACVLILYFGSGFASVIFGIAWAVDVVARVLKIHQDVTETPQATDFDRGIDLIRRMLWGAFLVSLALANGGFWTGLVALLTEYTVLRWAPKEIRVLRGIIVIWPFR